MRILERAPSGAVWSLLALSPQTFHTTQELCDRMQKHVAGDGCVHGFCVDFENTRVHIRNAHELWIVAALTTAYNNSLTAQQLQYGLRVAQLRHSVQQLVSGHAKYPVAKAWRSTRHA